MAAADQNFFRQLAFRRAEPAENVIRYLPRAGFPADPDPQPRKLARRQMLLDGLQPMMPAAAAAGRSRISPNGKSASSTATSNRFSGN